MSFHVLAVCIGNVCRSPVAERLLGDRLGAGFEVSSAGVRAVVGSGVHPDSLAELERLGGVGDGFAARQLQAPMLREADLVLTATVDLRRVVLEEEPPVLRRTFTWREFGLLMREWAARQPEGEGERAAAGGFEARSARTSTTGGVARTSTTGGVASTSTAEEVVAWAARHRSLVGTQDLDTPDPMGRDRRAHADAVGLIQESVEQIAAVLAD